MESSGRLWPVFCMLIVLVAGCSPRYSVSPGTPQLSASLDELVGRLNERTKSVQTLKALVTIRPEGRPSVNATLSFSRDPAGGPSSFRLKGFDPIGGTLFDLVSNNDRVRLTLPAEGRALESGPEDREDSGRSVQAAEAKRAVAALVGPFVEPGEIPVLERTETVYLVHLVRPSGDQGRFTKRLWFERGRLRLVREEWFEEDGAGADERDAMTVVEFFDYRMRSEIDWPDRIILTRSSAGARWVLEFREVHFNRELSSEEFRMP